MAAETGQPAVSADEPRSRKTPGSEPAVPVSLRRAPAGGPSPGYRVRYATSAKLLQDFTAALADGTSTLVIAEYARFDLLLIDEFGFDRLEHEGKPRPAPRTTASSTPAPAAARRRCEPTSTLPPGPYRDPPWPRHSSTAWSPLTCSGPSPPDPTIVWATDQVPSPLPKSAHQRFAATAQVVPAGPKSPHGPKPTHVVPSSGESAEPTAAHLRLLGQIATPEPTQDKTPAWPHPWLVLESNSVL